MSYFLRWKRETKEKDNQFQMNLTGDIFNCKLPRKIVCFPGLLGMQEANNDKNNRKMKRKCISWNHRKYTYNLPVGLVNNCNGNHQGTTVKQKKWKRREIKNKKQKAKQNS